MIQPGFIAGLRSEAGRREQAVTGFTTRWVTEADGPAWRRLFDDYARFYGVTLDDTVARRVWHWLCDPEHVLEGIVVEDAEGRLVGLAHVRACPRPLGGVEIGFLDDLFVEETARGSGAADALFAALRRLAGERGWPAIRWLTQHYNARGRAFYDRYTGGPSDFILYNWTTAP